MSDSVDLRCLACGEIHDGAGIKTLPDGSQVGGYSERWRAYTEARWVFKKYPAKPTRTRRKTRAQYINEVEQVRGKDAADQLKRDLIEIWRASK